MKVLVINAGSSSLKYQLMDPNTEEVFAKGLCERIGIDGRLTHRIPANDSKYEFEIPMPTHAEAIKSVLDALTSAAHGVIKDMNEIDAVGHRVVHGGEAFSKSVIIDNTVMAALESCIPLAPLHNPANITGIRACQQVLPGKPMVGVFDTAFHQSMPAHAFIYAIPYEYYTNNHVRRYGFHGTSHFYVSQRAAFMLGRPIEELKIVTCHLGNGSSVCAISGGKSIETSMGFTPLDGLPMGTRCGAIDVSIIEYLMETYDLKVEQVMDILNKQSGVLGVSGVSSDFRDIEKAAEEGNQRAQLAIDMFCYKTTKRIASASAAMAGVDAVVFTAGVGENSAELRAKIVANLAFMGIKVDPAKNNVRGVEADISSADATVRTLLIPTNEELVIAQDTARLVAGK